MPKYIDIHSHTNFALFDEDRTEVINRALENKTWLINIGTQFDTSERAVEISNLYKEGVYATIGLHPTHTTSSYVDQDELGVYNKDTQIEAEIFDKDKYRELSKKGKVVAVGECGLDYFHLKKEDKEKQTEVFIEQIKLANELNLPLMLHIRDSEEDLDSSAYQDTLNLLKKYSKVKGVIHFFAGTEKDAKDFLDFGFYISFAGVITYPPKKNNPRTIDYEKIIKEIPLDKIFADTDSPYVAPVPYRGKRNEPLYVREIVRKIAEIKGLEENDLAEKIVDNARALFNI
ncbi:MAG TPA: TatD family hydrolase [Candidatus Paceibacterota bacterium]|jgi:TatD DNase family protein|nr:TatD family hydrolase [Candidatus Paceibacterota bacterium]HQC46009.1 TatD family hydrolase [Candidatus Paceibacterota bacterium]